MNASEFKQKIKDNLISDDELEHLLQEKQHSVSNGKGGLINNLIKGYIDSYTAPNFWKAILEYFLIFIVIISAVFLNYTGKTDTMITSVILFSVLGFIFGKMK